MMKVEIISSVVAIKQFYVNWAMVNRSQHVNLDPECFSV